MLVCINNSSIKRRVLVCINNSLQTRVLVSINNSQQRQEGENVSLY